MFVFGIFCNKGINYFRNMSQKNNKMKNGVKFQGSILEGEVGGGLSCPQASVEQSESETLKLGKCKVIVSICETD